MKINYNEKYKKLIGELEDLIDRYNGKNAQKRLLARIKNMSANGGDCCGDK